MAMVLVIGGGIIGVSLTYRLARAGADVTLLEAGPLGSGTSSASFAWLNANHKPPLPYHRLNAAGMDEYDRLRSELPATAWLHQVGNTEWDRREEGTQRLRQRVGHLRDWGYHPEWLPVRELRRIEPDLVAPPDVAEFAYFPGEGYVEPVAAIAALAGAARDAGARIRTDCRVVRLLRHGDRVEGVEIADGDRFFADAVVSCVGRWTDDLTRTAGIEVPMAPTVGIVAISAPAPVRLQAVHHDESVHIRPDAAGRVMMHHTDFDAMVQPEDPVAPVPAFVRDLLERAVNVLPGLAGIPIEAARIAVRAIPGDGLSIVGPALTAPGLYLVVTHSGITLGPLLGRLVTTELLTGEVDPLLAPFRPDRLVRPAALAGPARLKDRPTVGRRIE